MRLFLNEQEVIDGICVFMAEKHNAIPEDVDVKEIDCHRNGTIHAIARVYDHKDKLENSEIEEGIALFLEQYHSFNSDNMTITLVLDDGVGAEVTINE